MRLLRQSRFRIFPTHVTDTRSSCHTRSFRIRLTYDSENKSFADQHSLCFAGGRSEGELQPNWIWSRIGSVLRIVAAEDPSTGIGKELDTLLKSSGPVKARVVEHIERLGAKTGRSCFPGTRVLTTPNRSSLGPGRLRIASQVAISASSGRAKRKDRSTCPEFPLCAGGRHLGSPWKHLHGVVC